MATKKPQKKRDKPSEIPPIPAVSLQAKISNFLVLVAGNIVMMVMSTLAIYNYDNPAPITHLPLPYPLSDVPPMFTSPTFYLVGAAVVLYLSALSSFPTPPNEDPYQPFILGAAVAAACVWVGFWEGALGGTEYWVKIRRVVPVAGLVGLIGSLVAHKVGREVAKGKGRGMKKQQ